MIIITLFLYWFFKTFEYTRTKFEHYTNKYVIIDYLNGKQEKSFNVSVNREITGKDGNTKEVINPGIMSLLNIRSFFRYKHHRQEIYASIRTRTRGMYSWRRSWVRAFVKNDWYHPTDKPFREQYAKWKPMLVLFIFMYPFLIAVNDDIYFSAAGNDTTGDGTQPNPYKTQAKHNTLTYSAPSTIYWNRGDNFRDSINGGGNAYISPRQDGTSSNRIVFDAYGTGADPIVEALSNFRDYVSVQNLDFDNTDPGGYCIISSSSASSVDGFIVDGCTCRNGSGILAGQRGGEGATVKNTTVHDCSMGIALYGDDTEHTTNVSCYSCTIYDLGGTSDGITIHDAGSNKTHYIEGPVLVYDIDFGTGGFGEDTLDVVSGKYGEIYGCVIPTSNGTCMSYNHSAGYGDDGSGYYHIHHCIFEGQVNIGAPNLKFYNNLVYAPSTEAQCINFSDGAWNNGADVNGGYQLDGIEMYYNTVINHGIASEGVMQMTCDAADGYASARGGIIAKNNIFYTDQTIGINWTGAGAGNFRPDNAVFNFDYNDWHYTGGSLTFTHGSESPSTFGFSDWQSTYGQDPNGMEADPLLIDYTGATGGWPDDAFIDTGSPCEGAGVAITTGTYYDNTGTPTVGIRDDYNGDPRNWSSEDIGFDVLTPGVAPSVLEFQDCAFGDIVIDLS